MPNAQSTPPATTTPTPDASLAISSICDAIRESERLLVTSHARPDGDAIGSQLALAFALRALGKQVTMVNRDPVPEPHRVFPGTDGIVVADRVDGDYDLLVVLECSDLARTGVAGLERYRAVNIDHHAGNTGFGTLVWIDESAAACAEMVADLIDALGIAWGPEIATHVYLAILTDTGSFRHSNITARTFEICRRVAAAGVEPAAIARQVYDTGSLGKLKLLAALLGGMRLEADNRLVVLTMDAATIAAAGATEDDTDGMINVPLSAGVVEAVVMLKPNGPGEPMRVSLRSKGEVDVRSVAAAHGGGGHRNAAGFTADDASESTRAGIVAEVARVLCR